jgi:hypothetical protein
MTDDLKKAQKIRQQNISNAQQELVQQKRSHSVCDLSVSSFSLVLDLIGEDEKRCASSTPLHDHHV